MKNIPRANGIGNFNARSYFKYVFARQPLSTCNHIHPIPFYLQLKTAIPKWLRVIGYFLFVCFSLITCWVGCGSLEQHRTEIRIRHYFGVASNATLDSPNIQSSLLLQFPIGTPSYKVEVSMAERGLGKDGQSQMWRPETNNWWKGNSLCCSPNDYSAGWWMRRITVCFELDEQQKVKQIQVDTLNYGL